jgi:hypothetical protein
MRSAWPSWRARLRRSELNTMPRRPVARPIGPSARASTGKKRRRRRAASATGRQLLRPSWGESDSESRRIRPNLPGCLAGHDATLADSSSSQVAHAVSAGHHGDIGIDRRGCRRIWRGTTLPSHSAEAHDDHDQARIGSSPVPAPTTAHKTGRAVEGATAGLSSIPLFRSSLCWVPDSRGTG